MFSKKRILVLLSLITLPLISVAPSEPLAQSTVAVSPSIRVAATWAAPLASTSLLDPTFLAQLNLLASRGVWELPPEEPSWPMMDEEPLVSTRQMDVMYHTVKKYQTKVKVRAMYKIGYKTLQQLNPDIDINNLQEGQEIVVWRRNPNRLSESRGKANRGRLRFGEPLPPGEGYIRLFPHRTFGTYYTVSEIVRVLDRYHALYPDASPLIVGDISFRGGRRIRPHRSHRTGRDVDITYPRHNEPPAYNRFHHIRRKDFDVERTFWLLKDFIDGGNVEYIFVNRRWQRKLRKYGQEQGAPDEWLSAVFQSGSMRPGKAIIRHAKGHDKHFHIRFKCQNTDRRCIDY